MAIENWDSMAANVDRSVEVPQDVGVIQEHLPDIVAVADQVIDILADGFQYSDVISFYECVGPVMDIAEGVAFLCSPGASWITGEVLRVSGGLEGVSAAPPKRPK